MVLRGRWTDWRAGMVVTIGATGLLTALLAPLESELALLNEGLVFLLLTLTISAVWGVRAGAFAAVLTNLVLNFFFIPPLHRFLVHDAENVVALAVFLIVSVVAGSLVSASRRAAERAQRRQAESQVLLHLSRALIGQTDPVAALAALCEHAVSAFQAPGAAVLSPSTEELAVLAHAGRASAARAPDAEERSLAGRVLASGEPASLGYSGLGRIRAPRVVLAAGRRGARAGSVTFIPLRIGEAPIGVLRLDGPIGDVPFRREPERLLSAFAQEAALAVQRVELTQAAARADAWRQADEAKSAIIASVSHDLKTPLAAIKASVSSLLGAAVPWSEEDRRAFLETIESQTDRLDGLISDVLDLSRIQSDTIASDKRPVFVRDLLEEACEAAASVTATRRVLVCAGDDLVVLADRALLRQALVNLLDNADKFSPAGRPVHLGARPQDDRVEVVLRDEGPGIAAADLPHIFESFYRGARDAGRTRGSGLGLAIAKGFAEVSGGSIRVETSPEGSTFIIDLPRVTAAATAR